MNREFELKTLESIYEQLFFIGGLSGDGLGSIVEFATTFGHFQKKQGVWPTTDIYTNHLNRT